MKNKIAFIRFAYEGVFILRTKAYAYIICIAEKLKLKIYISAVEVNVWFAKPETGTLISKRYRNRLIFTALCSLKSPLDIIVNKPDLKKICIGKPVKIVKCLVSMCQWL